MGGILTSNLFGKAVDAAVDFAPTTRQAAQKAQAGANVPQGYKGASQPIETQEDVFGR